MAGKRRIQAFDDRNARGGRLLAPEACRVGKRGTVVIPAALRRCFGIQDGGLIIAEARSEGILIRPATITPVQVENPAQRAAYLLNTATDDEEYAAAVAAVRELGLDPNAVPHTRRDGSPSPGNGAARLKPPRRRSSQGVSGRTASGRAAAPSEASEDANDKPGR